jgi:FkbM family methyltransferase
MIHSVERMSSKGCQESRMKFHHAQAVMPDGSRRPFVNFNDSVSIWVAKEVLSGKSYPPIPKFHPQLIFDIGANVGAALVFFKANYPEAAIVAFEPHPASFKLLEQNASGLPGVTIRRVAVSNVSGQGKLYGSRIGPCGFTLKDGVDSIDIEKVGLPEVIDEFGIPTCLKVDTEGHEVEILSSVSQEVRDMIQVVYVEYHCEPDRRIIDSLLVNHGLGHAKVVRPNVGELCYIKKDAIK